MDNKSLMKTYDIMIVKFFVSQKLETNHLFKKKSFNYPPPLCGTQFISLYVI